jgi:hydrogenase-4 component F
MVIACVLLLAVFAGIARNVLAMTVGAEPDRDAARTSAAPPDRPALFRQVPIGIALAAAGVLGFAAWPLAGPLLAAVAALGGVR